MTMAFGISAMGIVCPIGSDKARVAHGLASGSRAGLVARSDIAIDKTVYVGAVNEKLPDLPESLLPYDCRNNRMMLAALNQIRAEVDAMAQRFGRDRIAVVLGTSTGGIAEAETAYATVWQTHRWPNDFTYSRQELGTLAEFSARALGLTGPAYVIATACSSSGKAFASARRLIQAGLCDAAVVGGADTLCRMTVTGFGSLEAVSSSLCNPFSRNRDGINIGEAAAAFLLTKDPAPVMLLGIGESSDAHHVSAPDPEGRGAYEAMRLAMVDAGLSPADIAYVNLHGTATPLNDAMESRAVHALLGSSVPCSSTKSMTGHTLGAASACEAAFLWLTLHPAYNDGLLPPHLWDGIADPALPTLTLASTGMRAIGTDRMAMLSNSFAFGGSNVTLAFGRN
ncbi:beta-ketoacyl-[acyl-carrier-protein] synthase family protein [Dongia soli]|uniref:Beta-ketoacyl-[acyl-carrier-protein] synthase family protein n=1 Tax=Dongia soli TaxID=600628 RepID=A0ABU5EH69_9PROT|nr:beta-ketoacyl-[acyl-carrier-protein] synthase family protein [Dongia soli]MDY0885219.1 beta-ketoacyl-[acyl-carrier-protein] synthase family protein [Dongia soli]